MKKFSAFTLVILLHTSASFAYPKIWFSGPDSIAPDTMGMRELSPVELALEMTPGWNVGNSLEAIGGETAWGNPLVSQRLMDSVRAAGFKAVRIPVAWSKFTDEATYTIDTVWMERVEEVVNYVLNSGMYAIINIHWDGGWMQPTYADSAEVIARLAAMWQQIAVNFRDYNDSLLFAGTNEVMVEGDYGEPSEEYYTVQNGYNQVFVNTVRATGGRNYYRFLVVQGFNTNINYTIDYFEIPDDVTEHKLLVEVHYYDPYNFTINTGNNNIIQWGMYATRPSRTDTWANEDYADGQFQLMKSNFVDNGFAVILGEYAATARTDLGPELNAEHEWFRLYYMYYISKSITAHNLIPFYWDSGFTGNHASGIFNRSTGAHAWPEIIKGDALFLLCENNTPGITMEISNLAGIPMKNFTIVSSETRVAIDDLPAGYYIISERNTVITKFLKY
jgi:endoglucanase